MKSVRFPILLLMIFASSAVQGEDTVSPLTVFTARRIVTMEPSLPSATAVAIADGRIVAVGSLEDLQPWLDSRPFHVDSQFEDKVILPGFVEPHLHPYIAGVLLPMAFITPYDWDLPSGYVTGVQGREAYLARLAALENELAQPEEWLFTWGYHHLFHGELSRHDLDALSSTRPILVWHRSFHEIFLNSVALEKLGIDPDALRETPGVDIDRGRFYETGLQVLLPSLSPILLHPLRYMRGLGMAREVIHRGGITTVSDGAFGTFNIENEWKALVASWNSDAVPFRTYLLADGASLGYRLGNEEACALIESLPSRNTHRLRFREQAVKLFADGAFYSQTMQLGPPGYLDGHDGEWLMEPAALEAAARIYWNRGYQINVHANGDAGVDAALDVLEKLQAEHPRFDHRFALHHYGYSTEAQARRLGVLGGIVSANPYYIWALGDMYSQVGLGPERASEMVRLGALERYHVPVSYHSDFTMAPAEPLRLAWVAATRLTSGNRVIAPSERVSLDLALRGITIEGAYLLGLEDEIGTIRAGKKADFTILEEDPFEVPVEKLKDIPIWGTVFEGTIFPINR